MINVAIFASGNGSNAVNISKYFLSHKTVFIDSIYCNNPNAGIIDKSKELGLPCNVFNRQDWQTGKVAEMLIKSKIDFIVLAGFLWLVPESLIDLFPNKIINIHPSLLPSYGGKGMYGSHVHEAVIADKQKESGISIHLVNKEYDRGRILFQAKVSISEGETADSLAAKIHSLEHAHFPKVLEDYFLSHVD